MDPVIISLRGTSGSGKSYIARKVMARYTAHEDVHIPGRKRPFATVCSMVTPGPRALYVPGHYETDCGGADTIATYDAYFAAAKSAWEHGQNVLFEGLLSTPETRRTIELHNATKGRLQVVFLDVPLAVCVESVNQRRRDKAARTGKPDPEPLNPKNTESKHKQAQSAMRKLRAAGVDCRLLNRDEALAHITALLGHLP